MTRATVLIPTHSHGPLLRLAAATALAQTIDDLELFIVLDGADAATLDTAADLAAADPRVRRFIHDKGERHGEEHRHRALAEARGRIVCYLSDDDLWAPDHVEYVEGLLEQADFTHSQTVVARVGGGVEMPYLGDLADPWYRAWLTGNHNFIPLSAAGHTITAYRQLPQGWSPAPAGVWTDLHMWRKFLAAPSIRSISGGRPTVLHFPSHLRTGATVADRLAELQWWYERVLQPGGWDAVRRAGTDHLAEHAAALQRHALELEVAAHAADAELEAIRRSIAYRAGRRLAGIPIIGRIGRWVGAALAGRRVR